MKCDGSIHFEDSTPLEKEFEAVELLLWSLNNKNVLDSTQFEPRCLYV